jgi:hypothetical protein
MSSGTIVSINLKAQRRVAAASGQGLKGGKRHRNDIGHHRAKPLRRAEVGVWIEANSSRGDKRGWGSGRSNHCSRWGARLPNSGPMGGVHYLQQDHFPMKSGWFAEKPPIIGVFLERKRRYT